MNDKSAMQDKIRSIDWEWLSILEGGELESPAKELPNIILRLIDPAHDPIAEDIPSLIERYFSPALRDLPELQQTTFWRLKELSDYTFAIGPVRHHTPYVVPLIIDLLDFPSVSAHGILDLLLNYIKYAELLAPVEENKSNFRTSDLTREEVAKGITKYLMLLRSPDKLVKQTALQLLGKFDEHAEEILPVLHYRAKYETEPSIVQAFQTAIQALATPTKSED